MMNLFNRIVIIVLLLIVMIGVPLLLIFPEQAEYALRYTADVIQWNLDWLNSLTPAAQVGVRLMLAVVGLVVFLIGLLFLVLEIVRFRQNTVRLKGDSGELMVDSVSGHLAYYIDLLPDVLRVRPQVTSKGNRVRTVLYVETAPGVHVPEKSVEIRQTARHIIEEQLGLQTDGEIRVVIKPIAYPKGHQPPASPVPQPEPPEEKVEEAAVPTAEAPAEGAEEEESPELPEPSETTSTTLEVKRPSESPS